MNAKVEVGLSFGRSITCAVDGEQWYFVIRRTDNEVIKGLDAFISNGITAADVQSFIPNWRSVSWQTIRDGLMSKSESYAHDGDFRINVRAKSDSSMDHKQVIDSFFNFMKS